MFKQHWYEELNRQSKLSFYRTVKTEFRPEYCLTLAWGSRRALAKIRMSAHPLAIETGRYSSDSDMYDRRCQLCTCNNLNLLRHLPKFDPVMVSEWHLLCACPYYHDLIGTASGDCERQPEDSILHLAHGRFGSLCQKGSGQEAEEGVPGFQNPDRQDLPPASPSPAPWPLPGPSSSPQGGLSDFFLYLYILTVTFVILN